jgi:hypothetical protein
VANIDDSLFNQNYIALCSTNPSADQLNLSKLQTLPTPEVIYEGEITNDFPLRNAPTEINLRLKEGAQIMFLKNSSNYFNGKIGKIEKLEPNRITASTLNNRGEKQEFEIEKYTWKNIRYSFNEITNRIEQDILGSFTQYPLKLAWAITVHKSQGLTFEKVIIDINNFSPSGLVYVALSRCTSLNGLVLRQPIQRHQIQTDSRVIDFAANETPETLIVDIINHGRANIHYRNARTEIQKGNIKQALIDFITALKYRNDLETEMFEKYISLQLRRLIHYKELFSKGIEYFNRHISSLEIDRDHYKVNFHSTKDEAERLCRDLNDLKDENRSLQSLVKTYSTRIKDLESQQKVLESELTKLKKETWWDKLIR